MISGERRGRTDPDRSWSSIDISIYIYIHRDLGYLCLDFVPSFLFVDFPYLGNFGYRVPIPSRRSRRSVSSSSTITSIDITKRLTGDV